MSNSWEAIRILRNDMIFATDNVFLRYERQLAFSIPTTNTALEMEQLANYVETLRNIPQNYATPEEALAALQALTPPIDIG